MRGRLLNVDASGPAITPMRSNPKSGMVTGMHTHLHMQLARAIIDERLRDAEAHRGIRQAHQLGDRRPRLPHTMTRDRSVYDRPRAIASAGVNPTRTRTKGQS